MINILLASILPFFAQCKKEPSVPPLNVESSPVVWMFHTETNAGLAMNNFLYKNMIIQGIEPSSDNNNSTKIWALTLDSGKVHWHTEIPVRIPIVYEKAISKDKYLFVAGGNNLYTINMDNGEIVWSYTDPIAQSSIGVSIIGNYVCFSISGNRIIQFDIQTGTPKTILTLNKDDLDNFTPGLSTPSYWKHPSGDDILIMGNRGYNRTATSNFDRYDMLAYNLSADTMLWYKKGIPGIRGSISAPLVHENRAVFYVERNVECVNPLNGESIWTHTRHPEDNFSAYKTANITLWRNILIANPDSYHLYGIDIFSGNEIWVNSKSATMPNTTRIAMDKIWYSSGGVNCYDAQTGKTLIDGWRYKDKGSWLNPIAIDEKTGYIYTAAEGVIFCLDSKLLMKK